MLPYREIRLHSLCYEELIGLCVHITAHDIDELLGELEVGALEPHVLARRPVEDEPEVDVDDVAPIVDHDVAIVTVLDLKDIAHYGVGWETLYEVQPRQLELCWLLSAKLLKEVLIKIDLKGFPKLVSTVWVRHTLNYPT